MKRTFICSEDAHNKVWAVDVNGFTANVEWGRIGGTLSRQTKTFDSAGDLQSFVQSKIDEKLRKGYKEVAGEEVKKQQEIGQALGQQNKIQKLEWARKAGNNRFVRIAEYDPAQWVYVEILNSWSKDVTCWLLNKQEAFQVEGGLQGETSPAYDSGIVSGIRRALRHLAGEVRRIASTFAAMGERVLDLEGAEDEKADEAAVQKFGLQMKETAVSRQAIAKMVGLGERVLDI